MKLQFIYSFIYCIHLYIYLAIFFSIDILTKSMSFILSSKNFQYHEILFAKVLVFLLNLSLFLVCQEFQRYPRKRLNTETFL